MVLHGIKMLKVVVCAIFLFVAAASAVLQDENFENEGNRIGDWKRKTAQKSESFPDTELDTIEIWAKRDLKKVGEWTKEIERDAEGRVITKMIRTVKTEYVKIPIPKFTGEKCVCYHQTCGCCVHAQESEIHLNSTVCVNVTYLSEDYGISFTVTLNNHTLYNETVSVRNPPPVCVGFPYVKELADICVRLYDIDAKSRTFHACARIEARMKYVVIAHYDLGCFTIGSSSVGDSKKANKLGNSHPSVSLI